MDYDDALRNGSWVADPGEPVVVEPEHAPNCPARSGRRCRCEPRLVLREARKPAPKTEQREPVEAPAVPSRIAR
jgi:hypothetical protein